MAFNGLKSVLNDAFRNSTKLSLNREQRNLLRSNAPINSLRNTKDVNFTDVASNFFPGMQSALRRRIRNNEGLRNQFATKSRNIDNIELAMSLLSIAKDNSDTAEQVMSALQVE